MANPNSPFGARLIAAEGKLFRVRRYRKKSGNAIYEGDFVIWDSSGAVDIGGTGGPYLGVAVEFKASTDTTSIAIIDDPEALFEIQANNAIVQSNLGNNAPIVVGAGTSPINRSTTVLDANNIATTATLPLKIIDLSNEIGNAFGSFAKVLVKINNHYYKGGTGTLGV